MLKLKKLQILGFKSFCDRTELKFHGDGIAAIVGPNGCGKSNVADAISWVLGEQSAKSLRGSRMEDVIFAGTRDRKPTGMAEVSLTLIDPEVYAGADLNAETEIEIQDEMPDAGDWDEAALRSSAERDAEAYMREVQPGTEEVSGVAPATSGVAPAAPGVAPAAPGVAPAAPAGEPDHSSPATSAPSAVVLKIRRRNFKAREFKAGELVVTRRLFRSGDSEYLLNHKLCRLRDIQDIFMGTGLGPESYAIIEQGRIGQILSSKPYDRRAIIEEAAGVTKFKTRKRLAEARLEASQQNLARINDIFDEITRQMNSLKRQASKAERYARLREEMHARLRIVLASRFVALTGQSAALHCELGELSAAIHAQGNALQVLEGEHTRITDAGYNLEAESRRGAEQLNSIALESDRATARRGHNEERCAELSARSAAAAAELAQTTAQLAALESERAVNHALLESAAAEVAAAQHDLAQRQEAARAAAEAVAAVDRAQEQRRLDAIQAMAAVSGVRNQITQSDERIAAFDREALRLRRDITAAELEVESLGGQRPPLTREFDAASQQVAALTAQIDGVRARLAQQRQDETQSKRRLDSLRAEYASALGRKGSLEAVIAEHGYSTESVRRLFQSGAFQSGMAPAGVLADFLEVDQQYEHVVEDFLRDELNYIVVKSWDAADQGLQLLRSDVDGRATFLVHPDDSQAKFSFAVNDGARPAPVAGVVPVTRCLRVLNGFGRSLEVILPKLRDGYIVSDAGVARDLALNSPDSFFLASSGECFHNVTVTGGKQRNEGPLSMKRELRDLVRQIDDLERTLRAQEAHVATLGREIAELASLLAKLEHEKMEAEKSALSASHTLKQLETDWQRAGERAQVYLRELEQLLAERHAAAASLGEMRQRLAQHEQHNAELEAAIAAAQHELGGLKSLRDFAGRSASESQARGAVLEERRIAAAAALKRIDGLAQEVASRLAGLQVQIEGAAAEQLRREQENAELATRLVVLTTDRDVAQARAQELQQQSGALRQRLAAIEADLRSGRQLLDAARDRRGELSASAARLQSDTEHLAQSCVAELGATPDQLLAADVAPLVGDAFAAAETEYGELRARLDGMGPVNMMALEEYKETAARHTFLDTQRQDLLDSIENTRNTIREIDIVSRQKFAEAFARINENFQLTFRKLFGGGNAFMRLTDELNGAESGIDIVASPPAKKLQNVLLLSGGEKALTALALLVGIFRYQPSPFCILDEVDAPLDEANIGRFTDLVKEMSLQTQFIIITHSKKTMGIAPVMYGVTMQEPGVSKLVSVRFGAEGAQAATA